jgi:hypothetical protein
VSMSAASTPCWLDAEARFMIDRTGSSPPGACFPAGAIRQPVLSQPVHGIADVLRFGISQSLRWADGKLPFFLHQLIPLARGCKSG